ncbi:MAG: starch-binding protein [Ruminococcus sp.]|nr:starch-binding protein [Ruminococcus sp.]
MNKKITSLVLVLCIIISAFTFGNISAVAVDTDKQATSASTGAQKTIQGSAILHCFDWSYNSIKNNLKAISDAGYTAVQTSPVQPPKDYNSGWRDQNGQWWKLYQPLGIRIAESSQSWLGGKNELKSLCTEADKYGIKVIVDIVANHLANKSEGGGYGNLNDGVDGDLKRSEYYHSEGNYANDNDRRIMTQGHIGMPDLNTGNSYIQNKYKQLLIDCINVGVDGFRFDAAKHIELPTDDSSYASQFWPTVLGGASASTSNEIYYYGEILNTPKTDIANYTKYMSVTENTTSDAMLVAANNKNASGLASTTYKFGSSANKAVLWCESHDTYMGSSGSGGLGNTSGVSNDTIVKAWAIIAARADSSALFFARPASNMGDASSDTTWKNTAVAEVNKFKNYFDGQGESVSSDGDVAYVERGTNGIVISKLSGGGNVSLSVRKLANGSYKDRVSGNTFTVSGGRISGNVGSSGVAVMYNEAPAGPSASVTPGSQTYMSDSLQLTLKFENATSGQYSIDNGAYQNYTNGQTITIGQGAPYGTVTTVSVKASNGTTQSNATTYTYTKVDPNQKQMLYFDNSSYNWKQVYVYIYSDGSGSNGEWPGQQMQYDSSLGLYYYEVPDNLSNGYAIFTEEQNASDHRYPADGEPGMPLEGKSKIFVQGNKLEDYVPPVTPQPTAPTTEATAPPTQPPTQPSTPTPTTEPTTQPTTPVPTTEPPFGYYGDANADGTVDINDVTAIQKHLVSISKLKPKGEFLADVDGKGGVNIKDATLIQMYRVNMSGTSRVGQPCYL